MLGRGYRNYRFGISRFPLQCPTFGYVIKVRKERIKLSLRNRVILVIVASTTVKSKSHPGQTSGLKAIDYGLHTPLFGNDPPFTIKTMIALKSAGNFLIQRCVLKHIPRNLLDRELIEWHVLIKSIDHPVTPRPLLAGRVDLKAIAVCIACEVEPWKRHLFTIVR